MKTLNSPFLIIMQGLSGSGKTTTSHVLASELNAEVLHTDIERKRLFGLQPHESSVDAGIDIYTPVANQKTYQYLQQRALDFLRQGISVILDGAFLKKEERDQCQYIANSANSLFLVVKCVAPDSVLKSRITKRQSSNADASEAKSELIEQQKQWEEPITTEESGHTIFIKTTGEGWQETLKNHITAKMA